MGRRVGDGRPDGGDLDWVLAHLGLGLAAPALALRLLLGHSGDLPIWNIDGLLDLTMVAVGLATSTLQELRRDAWCYRLATHVAFLAWLWRELSYLPNGNGYVTVAWGGYALVLFLLGLRREQRAVLYLGLSTLLLVVTKLFLVDLSALDAIWRILLFLGFGGVFLALSYYLQTWLRRQAAAADATG